MILRTTASSCKQTLVPHQHITPKEKIIKNGLFLLTFFGCSKKNCSLSEAWTVSVRSHSHAPVHTKLATRRLICRTPKTLSGVLPHLFLIHSFSTLLITPLTIAIIKCSVRLYSAFYLLFFVYKVTLGFHIPVT